MKKPLHIAAGTLVCVSCSTAPKTPTLVVNGYNTDSAGIVSNRVSEKGKQGLWHYHLADGSVTDTVYKDGAVVQTK